MSKCFSVILNNFVGVNSTSLDLTQKSSLEFRGVFSKHSYFRLVKHDSKQHDKTHMFSIRKSSGFLVAGLLLQTKSLVNSYLPKIFWTTTNDDAFDCQGKGHGA